MLDTKNYKVVAFSWEEKRNDLFDGIKRLPDAAARPGGTGSSQHAAEDSAIDRRAL